MHWSWSWFVVTSHHVFAFLLSWSCMVLTWLMVSSISKFCIFGNIYSVSLWELCEYILIHISIHLWFLFKEILWAHVCAVMWGISEVVCVKASETACVLCELSWLKHLCGYRPVSTYCFEGPAELCSKCKSISGIQHTCKGKRRGTWTMQLFLQYILLSFSVEFSFSTAKL